MGLFSRRVFLSFRSSTRLVVLFDYIQCFANETTFLGILVYRPGKLCVHDLSGHSCVCGHHCSFFLLCFSDLLISTQTEPFVCVVRPNQFVPQQPDFVGKGEFKQIVSSETQFVLAPKAGPRTVAHDHGFDGHDQGRRLLAANHRRQLSWMSRYDHASAGVGLHVDIAHDSSVIQLFGFPFTHRLSDHATVDGRTGQLAGKPSPFEMSKNNHLNILFPVITGVHSTSSKFGIFSTDDQPEDENE